MTKKCPCIEFSLKRIILIVILRRVAVQMGIEEGGFSDNIRNELRSGTFKRILEWQTASGVLRFGIPDRTDGQVRMEIIHANNFASGENNFWSTEALR